MKFHFQLYSHFHLGGMVNYSATFDAYESAQKRLFLEKEAFQFRPHFPPLEQTNYSVSHHIYGAIESVEVGGRLNATNSVLWHLIHLI